MKKLAFIFLIFCSFQNCLGQTITAPAPLSIEANASNVDAGNFVINWTNATDNILVSLSLDYHIGASLSFPTTTGLTLNTGYTSWIGVTSVVFFGNQTNVNNALAAMTISMGSVKTAVKIALEATAYDADYKYNPVNKHFYRYVPGNITYADAKSAAANYSFKGKTGYLVTITSESENNFINNNINGNNIWVALTDVVTEGVWIIDAGPENGTIIKTQNGQLLGNVNGQYNNWCSGEPNNVNNEDYTATKWNGGTCWNDLPNAWADVQGYIVEISDDFPAGSNYSGVFSSFTVHNNNVAYTKSSSTGISSSGISNIVNLSGGLSINDGHTITLNDNHLIKCNSIVFNGTGKLILNSSTSRWSPETSSTDNIVVYSPTRNTNPVSWDVKSVWGLPDPFIDNNPNANHYTPWLGSLQGWSAGANDITQFITLINPIPAYIAGISTQGRQNSAQWVRNADIEVSVDGNTWTIAKTNATLNTNQTTIVNILFDQPLYAKFVRVKFARLTDWSGHISMRLGLLIKSYDFNLLTDGLKLRLDAGDVNSYGGSGTSWNDISGSSQHFTLVNSPSYNSSGFFDFDGVNDYASIPHNNVLKPTAAITVEQWISADNWAAGNSSTYKCSLSCTQGGGYSHNIWSNTFYSYLYAAGDYRVTSSSVNGFTGWHHFITTFDGRYVRLYVDAQNVSTIDLGNTGYTISYASNSIFIGAEAAASTAPEGFYWDGKIGATNIYNRALSAAQVLQNYLNTKSKYGL